MAVSGGFTAQEVRDLVMEYQVLPHGQKGSWLAARGISRRRVGKWALAVFEGDLERGLIPREGSPMTLPPDKRSMLAAQLAKERAEHDAEVARLAARVKELEETNAALGKAIGLLHQLSEQEPDASPAPSDPSSS